MRVLNLYAGIGGNRKLWPDTINGLPVEVVAVEFDPVIAEAYRLNFPQDEVVVADARQYLLAHFREFDFIWASPPCPTHSRMRTLWKGDGKLDNKTSGSSFKLPDMDLYSLIIFLKHFYEGDWVVENVISYYDPLILPTTIDNHYFWSNKHLLPLKKKSRNILSQDCDNKEEDIGLTIKIEGLALRTRRKMLNNCVRPETGLHVWNSLFRTKQEVLA